MSEISPVNIVKFCFKNSCLNFATHFDIRVQNQAKITDLYKKGKAFPLQAWTELEGSRRLRFMISRHTAHEGGKFVRPTHRQ